MESLSHRLPICLLAVVLFSATAFAQGSHDRTQFGHDITVGPGEEVSEATCFGCSVRVRGHVNGDVTTFGGSVTVEDAGEVSGDTTTFGGNIHLDNGSQVSSVTLFGGRIQRDPEATVEGDVTSFSGTAWVLLIFGLPLGILGALIALIVWLVRRLINPAMPVAANASWPRA